MSTSRSDPPPAVIGQQVADALAAEQRHRERHPDLVSPLGEVRYEAAETDVLLLVDTPKDDVIEALCRRFEAGDQQERDHLRAALTADDLYTVIGFARRSAVRTLRGHDREPARLGMLALEQIVDPVRVDRRDVLRAAGIVRHALNRMDGIQDDELRTRWMMTEVRLPDGRIDLAEVGRGSDAGAFDLSAVGIRVMAMLDADRYHHTGLKIGDRIRPVWFPAPSRPGIEELLDRSPASTGVDAWPRDGAPFDSVFLCSIVELAQDADGERWDRLWADPTPRDHAVLTVRVGRLAALFIVNSTRDGVPNPESDQSLSRWADPVRSILATAWRIHRLFRSTESSTAVHEKPAAR